MTDQLTEGMDIPSVTPGLVPGRLLLVAVQAQVQEMVTLLRPNAYRGRTGAQIAVFSDLIFAWNPYDGTYEVRDNANNDLLFHSRRGGRDVAKCLLDPMSLESLIEELKTQVAEPAAKEN